MINYFYKFHSQDIFFAWDMPRLAKLRLTKNISLSETFSLEELFTWDFILLCIFSLEEFFMKDLFFWGYKLCENIIFIRYELWNLRFIIIRNALSVIYVLGNFGTFYYNLDYLLLMFRKMIFFIWIFLYWFFIYWYFGDEDNFRVF